MNKYSEEYVERLFQAWYALNQPTDMEMVIEKAGASPNGDTPSKSTVRQFVDTYGWRERADAMNAKAIEIAESTLIQQKAEMLKRQAQDAFEVALKAKQHILEEGFDTTASAVAALKWASEEERTTRGVSDMLIRVSKMSKEDLEARALKLLQRTNEVIDGDVEVDNADNSAETSN